MKTILRALVTGALVGVLLFWFIAYYLLVRAQPEFCLLAAPVGAFAVVFIFIADGLMGLIE